MTMKMKTTNNIPPTDPAMMKILVEEAKTKEMCSSKITLDWLTDLYNWNHKWKCSRWSKTGVRVPISISPKCFP